MSAIRLSSAGATVLLGDPGVAGKEPTVVCTWCSQRGHLESTCIRDPRCARCFGAHPERNHDAIVMADRAYFQPRAMDGRRDTRGSFSDSRSRDPRGQRDYMQRDPGGQLLHGRHRMQQLVTAEEETDQEEPGIIPQGNKTAME